MSRPTSFREPLAWSKRGAYIVLFAGYFMVFAKESSSFADSAAAGYWQLAGLVVLALAFRLAHLLEARADEREQLIDLKATRIATRIAGIVTALGACVYAALLLNGENGLVVASVLISALVLGQIAGFAARAYHLKPGA